MIRGQRGDVHAGDGMDSLVKAVTTSSAVAEDLVVLRVGEGVLDAGAGLAMLRVVLFLACQQRASKAFAVRDDQPGVDAGDVAEDGHALAVPGGAAVPPDFRVRCAAGTGRHRARLRVHDDLHVPRESAVAGRGADSSANGGPSRRITRHTVAGETSNSGASCRMVRFVRWYTATDSTRSASGNRRRRLPSRTTEMP